MFVVLSALLIASCGGGGGGGAAAPVVTAPNTAPTPSPTPTPTAAPTSPPTGTTLLNFTGSHQFDTLESNLYYDTSAAGTVTQTQTETYSFSPTNSLSFIYDAPSASRYYYFSGSNVPPFNSFPTYTSVAFGNATRVSSNAAFTDYRTSKQGATYSLTLLNPGSGNSRLSLYYVGVGTAEGVATNTNGGGSTDFRAFGYSIPAEEAAVPKTGTGVYSGIVIGRVIGAGSTNVYTLSGTVSMTMNFAAQTYIGALTLVAINDRNGERVLLGDFPLASTAPYPLPLNTINAFIGSGRDSFRAKLAGSNAEELSGSFNLVIPGPRDAGVTLAIVGAVAARR
jgi:hypothetical protein